MRYLNIIYDNAFRYLMLNVALAQQILSVLLGMEIIDLVFLSTETAQAVQSETDEERARLKNLRLDYRATIRTKDGKQKMILIELQKEKDPDAPWRFRYYLSETYSTRAATDEAFAAGPVTTVAIYITGFPMFEGDHPAVRAYTVYEDLLTGELLEEEKVSNFAKVLTHEGFFFHTNGFKKKLQSELTSLMRLFDQSQQDKKDPHVLIAKVMPPKDSLAYTIIEYMNTALRDEVLRRAMREEELSKMAIRSKELELLEITEERDKAISEKEAERAAKEAERAAKEAVIRKSVLAFHAKGMPANDIALLLDLELYYVLLIIAESK
jgi:predicted transposase/invertase (TIGR01784 family)